MCAADFRAAARRALVGRWPLAILTGLVAAVLGGADAGVKFNVSANNGYVSGRIQLGLLQLDISPAIWVWLSSVALVALVAGLAWYVVGSVIRVGYARFNLDLVGGADARLESLFDYFRWFKTAFCARFLTGLLIFLWSLLLIIPGIVATYSYAMVPYILAEHPEMTAGDAIAQSKRMMEGNRWRLFCLEFSFIGWAILCAFTLGIGNLFLMPYQEAAKAVFYRDLQGLGAAEQC